MKKLSVVEKILTVLGVFVIAVAFYTTSQMHFINTGYATLRNGPTASVRDIMRAGVDIVKISGLITDVATMITRISDVDTAQGAVLIATTLCSIKLNRARQFSRSSFAGFLFATA